MGERLTKKDVKRIEDEISYRKLVVRKQELEALKEAREQGDLSENYEYTAAKRDKNKNESRIRYLERMLKEATVIDEDDRLDVAGLDKTLEIYFEDEKETEEIRLVTSIRGNSLENKISIESPLGKALLGHRAGDRVYVPTPSKDGYYVVIQSVRNTVDDGTDTIRSY